MKFSLFLLAGLLAAAFAFDPIRKIEFQPGKTYIYSYRTQLTTGIPELSEQYAGLLLKSKLILRPLDTERVWMKLEDVRGGQQKNLQVPDLHHLELPTEVLETLERELSKPIEFHYVAGKVVSFRADSQEPEWSLNIKKAVLSLLSVDLAPKKVIRSHVQKMNERPIDTSELTYYGVYEQTVGGHCETFYEIKQTVDPRSRYAVPEAVLNVTKVINYSRCAEEPTLVNANLERQGCDAYCAYYKQYKSGKLASGSFELKGYYPVEQNDQYKPQLVKTACDCKNIDIEMPVDQFTTIKYNISQEDRIFQSIHSDGQIILNQEREQLSVATVSTLYLVEIRDSEQDTSRYGNIKATYERYQVHESLIYRLDYNPAITGHELNLDIPYYGLFKFPSQENLVQTLKQSIYTIVEDILKGSDLKSKYTMHHIMEAVDKMAVLKEKYLTQVFEHFIQRDQEGSIKERTARKVFLDILGLTGTNQAAKLIREALVNSHVSQSEAHELLEALPNNIYWPTKQTIDSFMKLVAEQRYVENKDLHTVLTVAVGKLIKKGCDRVEPLVSGKPIMRSASHPRSLERRTQVDEEIEFQPEVFRCNEAHVEQYVQKIAQLLTEATEYTLKSAYIEALAQISHPKVLSILEPYVSGKISAHRCPGYTVATEAAKKEECDFLRTQVIYALHQFSAQYPAQVRALTLPVYRDVNEAHEIRIAALTVIMYSGPTKYELQSIVNSLRHENNRQIIAMTYGYLKQTSKLTHPKFLEIATTVKEILRSLPEVELSGYSKVHMHEFVHPVRNDGAFLNHHWIKSNNTLMPTAFYMALGRLSPLSIKNTAALSYQQKGFERFVTKLYTQWAADFSDEWEKLVPEVLNFNTQSEQTKQILEQIREKLNLKIRESADLKLKVSYKLFDNVAFHTFDEALLRHKLTHYVAKAVEMSRQLARGQTLQFVKIFMPSNYAKMVVNEFGMPVVIRQRHPLLITLKIEKIPTTNMDNKPVLALRVHPMVSHLKSLEVTTPIIAMSGKGKQIGTSVTKQMHFSYPVQMILRWSPVQRQVLVSVSAEKKTDILVEEILPITFVKDNVLFWDANQKQNLMPIRVLPVPHKSVDVFGERLFGYGLELIKHQDMPMLAEYEHDKWHFNPLSWRENIHRFLSSWINTGNGYRLQKMSLKTETEQPTYDFAIQYKKVENFEKFEYNTQYKHMNIVPEEYMEVEESKGYPQWIKYDHEYETVQEYGLDRSQAHLKLERIMGKLILNKEQLRENVDRLVRRTSAQWKPSREHDRKPAVIAHNLVFAVLNHGQIWKQIGLNAIYAHTLDKQVNWVKMDGFVRYANEFQQNAEVSELHQHFCAESVLSYPKMLDIFRFKPTFEQPEVQYDKLQATMRSVFGWGKRTCSEGKIVIDSVNKRTEDKVFRSWEFDSKDIETMIPENAYKVHQGKPWYRKQCVEDIKYGRKSTVACDMAIQEQSWHNQYVMDIKYENLPIEVRNFTRKLEMALKAKFYKYMDFNAEQIQNEDNRVKIITHYSEKMLGIPVFNVYVQKPTEEIFFKRIVPFHDMAYLIKKVRQNSQDRCMIVDRSVRTFDNVTYQMPENSCKYLLAMDCSEQQRFAVYSENRPTSEVEGKIYTIIVRGKVIKVLPIKAAEKMVKIVVDEQNEYEITLERPFVYRDLKVYLSHFLYPETFNTQYPGKMLTLEINNELKIVTDGQNIEIKTHPRFTGKTCGLCGNKDFEAEQEFEGANQCEYKRVEDFVYSYAIRSESCQVPEVRGPMRCLKPRIHKAPFTHEYTGSYRHHEEMKNDFEVEKSEDCEYRKNYYVRKNNQVCFTKLPLKACRKGCVPEQEVKKTVPFVCYPAEDVYTQQMIQDSRFRVLSELKNSRVRFEEHLTVPTVCTMA